MKNYYARNAEKFGWDRVTQEANMLISRGHPTPAPPSQPVPVRKRYEAQQRIQDDDEEEVNLKGELDDRAKKRDAGYHPSASTSTSSEASSKHTSPKVDPVYEKETSADTATAAAAPPTAAAQRGPRLGFFMDTVQNPIVAPVSQAAALPLPIGHDSRMGIANITSATSSPSPTPTPPVPMPLESTSASAPVPARMPPKMSSIANLLNDDVEAPKLSSPAAPLVHIQPPQSTTASSSSSILSTPAAQPSAPWNPRSPRPVLHRSPPAPPPQLPALQPGYTQPPNSLFQYGGPPSRGVSPGPPPPPLPLFSQPAPMLPNPFYAGRPQPAPGLFQSPPAPSAPLPPQQQGQGQGQSPRIATLINSGNPFELPTPFSSRESNERGV